MSKLGLILGLVGAAGALNTTASNEEWSLFMDLCNPVIPYCDGAWTCTNTTSSPTYHHKYGMICYTRDVTSLTSLVSNTEMCPFGGSVGTDGMCHYVKQASSLGCPDFTEQTRMPTTDVLSCLYKYPIFCPKEYLYFKEYNSCMRFYPAICSKNSTDCGKYYCERDVIPRYFDRYSTSVPVCIYLKYPAPANDAGYLECQANEVLIDKYCINFEEAKYLNCTPSVTPTTSMTPLPTREMPSQSPKMPTRSQEPTREMPSESPSMTRMPEQPSIVPYPSREVPSESSTPTRISEPTKEVPSQSPSMTRMPEQPSKSQEPTREMPSESPSMTRMPEQPSKSQEPTREMPSKSPIPSIDNTTYDLPCYRWVCDGGVQPNIVSVYVTPFCVYPKSNAIPDSQGNLTCPTGLTVWGHMCAEIKDAYAVPCNTTNVGPSMTPRPSSNIDDTYSSQTPRPTSYIDNTTKPCNTYYCKNGVIPYYVASNSRPICIYQRYQAMTMSDGTIGCPNGGVVMGSECIIYEDASYIACETITATATATMTMRIEIKESLSASASTSPSSTPFPTRDIVKASETASTSMNNIVTETTSATSTRSPTGTSSPSITSSATVRIIDKSSLSPTSTSRVCDKYICPDGKTPEFINGLSTPVCIYGRYRATQTAAGFECLDGGRLVVDECILYEASMYVACTSTPTPTYTGQIDRPVESRSPQPEKPSESTTPVPSKEAVNVPTISATITIEIKLEGVSNTTADLSVFQNDTVLYSLREAIAKALKVPIETIVIESLTWVENGNVKSVIRLNNSTSTSGGRRLGEELGNLDIKYKVINAPDSLMTMSSNEFATMVETSNNIGAAAASMVSLATGIAITQDAIAVQSTEMVALQVNKQEETINQQRDGMSYTAIGGIIAGAALVVGATGFFVIKRELRKRDKKRLTDKTKKVYPVDDGDVIDRVNIVNPIVGVNNVRPFEVVNKYFSHSFSSKELDGVFPPQQARRSMV